MVGRQQRQPSRESPSRRATEFLEFVHSDLGGTLPATRLGHTFYISFFDDSTGCYYIEGMRHKSQAFEKFVKFVTWAQNQSGNKLKRYRTDFGGEFDNELFKTWCEENGVQWEPSAPYSPEQNGKAERLNYTLMSSVRSILSTMKLPKSLWLEILKTVAYLKNRSPGIDGITPFEHLKGEKPNLRHLKIVGSRAWVHIPKEKRRKLDERSWQGIFVGYEGKNQYRIYNPRTGKVHVARDVKIDEYNLYDKSATNPWELADEYWSSNDDAEFADPHEFEEELDGQLHATEKNPLQSGKGEKTYEPIEEETPAENAENDSDSALSSVPDHMDFPNDESGPSTRRSQRNPAPRILYPGQIAYGSEPLSKAADSQAMATGSQQKSANFVSSHTAKSHEHMVRVLRTLSANVDNEGPDEPANLEVAMSRHDWPEWKKAMESEYNSLIENGTWEVVSPPTEANVITGRWVFRLKKDRFGNVLKYKARWVAHGYKQKEGLDYVNTFAAVVKPMSYKCLMAVGVRRKFRIRHMDVVTAFLYGFLDEVIYVEQPHLFEIDIDKVCKLLKALYGLKQAPHIWYKTLVEFLWKLGLQRLELDHGIFVSEDKQLFIAVYVDDLLLFGSDLSRLEQIQQSLRDRFKMTDLGDISHYLGMEVDYILGDKITLRQSTYLKKVLDRFDMTDCKPASLPMNPGVANSLQPFDGTADPKTIKWYQSAIGSLMWPAVHTRPDIAYSVGVLSRYCSNPGPTHCSLVVQVFRYLSGTLDLGITFQADSSDELVGYTDSDYAGLVDGRKSTGGYIFMLSGGPLSHQSKLQNNVALSSTEAEYMAACEAGKEALWVSRFLAALGFRLPTLPVDLRVDNKGAISLTENPEFHRRTKHIEVRYHWIREKVESN